jgi:hypothetical protein
MSTSGTALRRRSTFAIRADHLDVEAGHPALADLVERVRDAVHAADAVGDERDAQGLGGGPSWRTSLDFSAPRKAVAGT